MEEDLQECLHGIASASEKNETIILEKMNTIGKKLRITGKGRCNITNAIDISDFIKNIPRKRKVPIQQFPKFHKPRHTRNSKK